jgi:hypothetical protein
MFEELLGYTKYDLVQDNVRLQEQMESQQLIQEMTRMLQEQAATPANDDEAAAQEAVNGPQG